MLPERTSTKLTDTHKNNKRNLCNWVSLYPSLPSPLHDYLNKASLFGGQKLLGELMFFGRERMLLWSLSRSCQHHRCCSSAYLLLLWSHTQHGHNTQYTHTRGTHCYHTQVIIVKPSQTKHDLLNSSIPFNLFPINWKKSNGQCTISQVAKRERVEERERDTEESGGATRLGKGASIFHVCCELFHVFPLQLVFSPLDFGYNAIRIPSESHSCCWEKRQRERDWERYELLKRKVSHEIFRIQITYNASFVRKLRPFIVAG